MLVLGRKRGERILIGENVVVTVIQVQGDRVKLGIEAPVDLSIHRQEVADRIVAQEVGTLLAGCV